MTCQLLSVLPLFTSLVVMLVLWTTWICPFRTQLASSTLRSRLPLWILAKKSSTAFVTFTSLAVPVLKAKPLA
ncbi:hypothetical protein Arash_gp251c [Salmonella phage Arash]|nr:hypothetical protein Arash_gp251c [Salmonella phage Arash]